MSMYNLLEYSKNYWKTTGSLWNYYRDKPNSGVVGGIEYSIIDSVNIQVFQLQSKLYQSRCDTK